MSLVRASGFVVVAVLEDLALVVVFWFCRRVLFGSKLSRISVKHFETATTRKTAQASKVQLCNNRNLI